MIRHALTAVALLVTMTSCVTVVRDGERSLFTTSNAETIKLDDNGLWIDTLNNSESIEATTGAVRSAVNTATIVGGVKSVVTTGAELGKAISTRNGQTDRARISADTQVATEQIGLERTQETAITERLQAELAAEAASE